MSFFEFPHTRTYDSDLGWLIAHVIRMSKQLENFINFNTIKYADPIAWNITTQYEANTVVINPADGTAYISTRPVPSGVLINNTDYWTPIFNYGESLNELREQIAAANEETSPTASKAYTTGELLWIDGKLYEILYDINTGTAFIENENIKHVTIAEKLSGISDEISEINNSLRQEISDREDADTALNDMISEETNERVAQESLIKTDLNKLITIRPNTSIFADTVERGKISIPDGYSCGGCCLDSSNLYLYVGVYQIGTDSGAYIAKIKYDDILNSAADEVISPETVYPFESTRSHMNGLCYYNGKVYVAAYRNDVGGGSYNNINILDVAAGTINTIALPINLTVAGIFIGVIDSLVTVIVYNSDFTTYKVWKVINNVAMPVYTIIPEVNGWFLAQEMHVSTNAIYQLQDGRYEGDVKVAADQMQVITLDGRLSYFVYFNDSQKHGELEGITKEPGVDKFTFVNNTGKFFTSEPTLLSRDRNTFNIVTFKRALNKAHQLYPDLTDTVTGVCEFTTGAGGNRYPSMFTIPVRSSALAGFTMTFLAASFATEIAPLGSSFTVMLVFNANYKQHELMLTYQLTNTTVGNYSGNVVYNLWVSATHLTITDHNGNVTHYYDQAALDAIPVNIYILADSAAGDTAPMGYISAANLGL